MKSGRPSTTAIKIARGLYSLARVEPYGSLLPEGTEATSQAILRASGHLKPWMERFYERPAYQTMLGWSESASPGTTLHMVLRKRVIDDQVHQAVDSGARQLLVLGAGFDTLATRLALKQPQLLAVEIDHPDTHTAKHRGVEGAGLKRPNLRLLGVDLGERGLDEVLAELPDWEPDAPTVVVAEGLLMYLDEEDVRRLLRTLREHTGPDSRFVFSTLEEREGVVGPDLGWMIRSSLAAVGEGLRWGVRQGTLAAFLAEEGWQLEGPEALDLRALYLKPAGIEQPLADDERVTVALRA